MASDDRLGDGAVIGFLAIFGAIFVVGTILVVVIGNKAKSDEHVARALKISSNRMNKQLKGYGKNFKDGYNSGRNRAIGLLAFMVPTASAVDVETKFSDGVGQVLEGVWLIIYPYASVAFVLFLIIIALKKLAGRQKS
ncbi:hypothetical protein AB4Y95_00070 [Arthrobacter sp. M-10]|uniref:hypothetical protein n=1 Tax=Arthrobacter sp. M-10 TaxID=3233037 RepID=UPI003F907EFF